MAPLLHRAAINSLSLFKLFSKTRIEVIAVDGFWHVMAQEVLNCARCVLG